MISNLLSFMGTLILSSALVAAGYWAVDVYGQQPALPDLATPDRSVGNQAGSSAQPAMRRQRPDVFYAALLERPLFAPGRRPVIAAPEIQVVVQEDAPAPPPEQEKPPVPELALLGVMGSDNNNRALVSNAAGDPVWINPGTTIAGWRVVTIGPDWLELKLDTETIRIEMYQQ